MLPTVWADLGTVLEGAAPGEESRPPTPELWKQELARKGDSLEYDGLKLSLLSGDKPLSTVEIAGGGGKVYSTEEHVVGTWLDGRPIYEKTIVGTTPASPGTNGIAKVGFVSDDIDVLVGIDGSIFRGISLAKWVGLYCTDDYQTYIQADGYIYMYRTSVTNVGPVYITVQWVKAADKTNDTPAEI